MNTQKIKIEEVKPNPVINKRDMVEINENNKPKKDHKKIKLIFKIIAIVILLVSLIRVPYVGSYLDGLFDYLFGQAKYIFYIWGLFTFIVLIYNGRIARIMKTRKYYIFSALSLLAAGCIISGSYDLVKFFGQHPSFVERMTQYNNSWMDYFLSHSYSNYFHNFISGGILAVLLSFLFNFVSYAVLVVFAAILLIICIFVIFNINYKSTKIGLKLRGFIIRKLGGSFKYDGYNELSENQDNQNKFNKVKKSDIEKAAAISTQINFDLLPQTDINNDNHNWKKAAANQAKLANLFKEEKISCVSSDINIYTTYSEICFDAKSNADIKKIVQIQDKISKAIKMDKFNLSYRGNLLSIDYDNLYFSKLSLKSVSTMYKNKPLTAFFGIDKNKKLAVHDFKLSPTALILGKKGSGSATLAVLMALTVCYSTSPEMLDLVILNPNCDQSYAEFRNMPHTMGKTYESINSVSLQLHDLQTIVNQRASLLNLNNVDNIEQFNKITTDSTSLMKNILVVIPNFESSIRETFQNSKIIEELLVNGPKVGVYTILQSYDANNEALDPNIFNNVSDKYILALEDKKESIKIFDNERACQLHSNGDCLHFYRDKIKNMERIQVCNINKTELTTDIDIAKTFYSVKKEQSQVAILEDKKDEQQKII